MEALFSTGRVEVRRRRLVGGWEETRDDGRDDVSLAQLGDEERRGRSITEGFPAKTTETNRAVSSWLPRRSEDC